MVVEGEADVVAFVDALCESAFEQAPGSVVFAHELDIKFVDQEEHLNEFLMLDIFVMLDFYWPVALRALLRERRH